eukprot:1307242-Rhodomonas_salina.1
MVARPLRFESAAVVAPACVMLLLTPLSVSVSVGEAEAEGERGDGRDQKFSKRELIACERRQPCQRQRRTSHGRGAARARMAPRRTRRRCGPAGCRSWRCRT